MIVRELLIEGLDDWLPVDRLLDVVRDSVKFEAEDFRGNAMAVLKVLLQQGLMQVGDLGEDGFEAWSGTVESILDRLSAGLDHFDWAPLGAFCWIANTPRGSKRAMS
ncbi:hypothetical protein [Embleya sp. NPDC059259]|uniref:hypothetical protein n=1 Tax=unclassified Embleya TaxID=2699296 RepID=UPI0036BFC9ED